MPNRPCGRSLINTNVSPISQCTGNRCIPDSKDPIVYNSLPWTGPSHGDILITSGQILSFSCYGPLDLEFGVDHLSLPPSLLNLWVCNCFRSDNTGLLLLDARSCHVNRIGLSGSSTPNTNKNAGPHDTYPVSVSLIRPYEIKARGCDWHWDSQRMWRHLDNPLVTPVHL